MESKSAKKTTSIVRYGLIAMTLTHVLAHVLEFIHPAIYSILRDEFSLSLQQLGIIAAIPPLCQAIGYIPSGLLSDRIGAKKMLLISFTVAVFGALLASQATNPLMLIAAICLIYVNVTAYHPASYSFTSKLFKDKDRSKALGIHGAGGTFGNAVGPLSVSILVGVLSFQWRQVYLILAAPVFLGFIIALYLGDMPVESAKSETKPSGGEITPQSFFSRSMVMFIIYQALSIEAGSMISFFLVLYLQDVRGLNIALASLISSGSMLMGLLASPIGGFTASRFGDKKWLLTCRTIGGIFLALSAVLPNAILFATFYLAHGFFNTMGMAARSAIMANLSPSKLRGIGYSLLFLPGSITVVVGSFVSGTISEFYGYNTVFALALGITVIELLILRYGVKVDQ